jgi:type IV pilus assembly protein PilO
MRFLPNDQKDQLKVAAGVVGMALAAAYYQYPHTAAVEENEALRERVEVLEAANQKARREATGGKLDELRQQAARSRATLAVLRRLVPTEHEVPALLEQVSTAARRAGLEIGGVQPEPVLGGDTFDTYRYKVTVVGGYHALSTFLANVGSLPRIVAPVTFQLAPATNAARRTPVGRDVRVSAPLQASVTIQTYVVRASVAPTATGGGIGDVIRAAGDGEVLP